MNIHAKDKEYSPQVFISYAQADKAITRQIADTLQNAGLKVWFDEWELMPGDSIIQRIEDGLRASDFLLVLLSPHSVNSQWVMTELNSALSSELRTRAVTVIPALIEDCKVPTLLANLQHIDLRTDLKESVQILIQQLRIAPEIDFSRIDGLAFEKLVVDLLKALGFSVDCNYPLKDAGFDFVAAFTSKDPFGIEKRELWLVEVKLYKNQRVSLHALRQMISYMMTSTNPSKGLIITNGQLTSVAIKFLEEMTQKFRIELRIIDGTELRALLLRHPQLVKQYFGKGKNR